MVKRVPPPQNRMRKPEWKTFHVDNYEDDTLLLMFVSRDEPAG